MLGRGQGTNASTTCNVGISKLRNNCITVVDSAAMSTESTLCLGCSEVIPRTYDKEYEKCLIVSVQQATITQTFPYLVIRVVKTSRLLSIPITASFCLAFRAE